MTTQYSGGCSCGAIRYEIATDPLRAGQCQCRACQKDTGSGHSSYLAFPAAALTLTGRPAEFERTADSGNRVTKLFCPTCGTPLLRRTSGMPNAIGVYVGSLDDPSRFAPQIVVFAARGHAWDKIDASLPKFPQMPPAPTSARS